MKVKQLTLTALVFSLAVTISLIACKKDKTGNQDSNASDIEIATDNTMAESGYNDMTTMIDEAVITGSVSYRPVRGDGNIGDGSILGGPCATLTVDTISSPRSITVDFGSTNCLCADGRNRRGKIVATYTGRYRDANTVITITPVNYFVNDNKLAGTKTVTNQGLNNSGNLVYKVEVNGQIIKANNGGTATWTSTRYREWTAGANTAALSDDVYSITGNASGTTASGNSYSIAITQPLVRRMNCRWFESGVLQVTPQGRAVRTLDYGNTGCDANATLTILGVSIPIVLP